MKLTRIKGPVRGIHVTDTNHNILAEIWEDGSVKLNGTYFAHQLRLIAHYAEDFDTIWESLPEIQGDKSSPGVQEPRTVREWLETLPGGYRERALQNMNQYFADTVVDDVVVAIAQGLSGMPTPEGFNFWHSVHAHFVDPSQPLPPLPEGGRS